MDNLLKIKIVILEKNISLNDLIYIDILSRILLYSNNEVSVDYYIYDKNEDDVKGYLNNIRIFFNKYIDNYYLDKDIEMVFNIIRGNHECYIDGDGLFLNGMKLIDNYGEYTDDLRIVNYLYRLSKDKYDRIIVFKNDFDYYDYFIKMFNINNVYRLESNDKVDNEYKLDNDINKWRLGYISGNLDIQVIESLCLDIEKVINYQKFNDSYNQVDIKLENSLRYLLNKFPDIIKNINYDYNINLIIQYIEYMVIKTKRYVDMVKNSCLSNEQLELIINLREILTISLDLLGIIIPI